MLHAIRLLARAGALAFALALATVTAPAQAQNAYYFPNAQDAFDPAVPTPEQFLGYPLGEHYTRHDRLVAYFQELARVSDRVSVQEIGQSYERRPLIVATITSPRNHARLDDIRRARAAVLEPGRAGSAGADAPVVVGLYYSVHGNETSSGEAAMLTAYYLAAHRGEDTQRLLENAVVLVDPAQNPDGRDRAANWHNAYASDPPVADPLDKEHVEPFPAGRTNHYFTDLNRDWLAITQQETRAKIGFFHQWYPHVQIDFHEMGAGSTYYFEPSPASMQSPLVPQASYDFNVTLARYHAQALDALGSLYYTGENFDNFSPVYGSTYPDFHGGVGVTVEQGSSRGRVQETAGGPLEFRFTIRNQVATGLGTVRGAVAERAGLYRLQEEFYRSALQQARKYPVRDFVFGDAADRTLTRQLLDLLLQHRIEVRELAGAVTVDGKRFEPGAAYVVHAAQPQFRLVHSIFEQTPATDGSVYGSTSYAIAHAYGLRFAASRGALPAGAPVAALPAAPRGGISGGEAAYAYALDWRDYGAAAALYRLLDGGVRVRSAFAPFTAATAQGQREFGRGSLVVAVAGQTLAPAELRAKILEAAEATGLTFHALSGGHSLAGVDLGSDSVKPLRKPEVALVFGQGVNPSEIGSTWFLLDRQLHLPATRLDPSQLAKAPLGRYTSIVLGGGNYADWSPATVAALKRWVEGGGSLVAFGTAAKWALDNGLAGERGAEGKPEAAKPEAKAARDAVATDEPPVRRDFASRRDVLAERRTSGNLLLADVDDTHPLAFGVQGRGLYVNKETDVVLPPAEDEFSNVVAIPQAPWINGYLSAENRKRIAGGTWARVSRAGSGNVVLFADDPAHRKYWHGTERLLVNALFFADQLAPPSRRGG